MKINFLTWNTQLYEYGNIIHKAKPIKPIDYRTCIEVIHYIMEHMKKDNAIAILQEIPLNCNKTRSEHIIFTLLRGVFSEDEYKILYNKNKRVRNQIKMTVVIGRKDLIEKDDTGINSEIEDFCNCFYSFLVKPNLRVVAVHQSLREGGYVSDKLSRKKEYDPFIILGDFNSGDYAKRNETKVFRLNRQNYLDLISQGHYIDICEGKETREFIYSNGQIYKTPIDHVLIKKDVIGKILQNIDELKIDDTLKLSDHYPITFSFDYHYEKNENNKF